jgi:hypothetical protein
MHPPTLCQRSRHHLADLRHQGAGGALTGPAPHPLNRVRRAHQST